MNITVNVKLYSINCSDFHNQTGWVGFSASGELKASGTFLARRTAPARYDSQDTKYKVRFTSHESRSYDIGYFHKAGNIVAFGLG